MSTTETRLAELEQRFCDRHPRSRLAYEECRQWMPGVAKGAYFYPPFPLTMERGESFHLFDVDGHRYLDFANHHTTQILGHSHPAVMRAINEQLGRAVALGAPVGNESPLAEELCRRVPSFQQVRFCNSGTEATLHAIRLARAFTGRVKIAKFEGGYHGSHDAVEISVAPPLSGAGTAEAPVPVPGVKGMSTGATEEVMILPYSNESAVESLIERHHDQLACVILDPKAGLLNVRPEFIQFVRELTSKFGLLLILDEIVSFRVDFGGYQSVCGIDPDLTTLGKFIGGGFPIGAIAGRQDLMSLLDNTGPPTGLSQSGTFSAHPITMAAGAAALQQMDEAAFQSLNRLGRQLHDGLESVARETGTAAQIVSSGSVFSIYFCDQVVADYRATLANNRDLARQVFLSLLEQGCFLSHTLTMNALSLPMAEEQVCCLVDAFRKALEQRTV